MKAMPADLQSAPFGHSGNLPWSPYERGSKDLPPQRGGNKTVQGIGHRIESEPDGISGKGSEPLGDAVLNLCREPVSLILCDLAKRDCGVQVLPDAVDPLLLVG